jgi:DNA-binding MarR family transcriptional regulator
MILKADSTQNSGSKAKFVNNYLLYLLAAASEKASGQFHAQVRKAGLRVPEWRVVACLYDSDKMMITELADLSLMEQSRMTRIIAQMAERGIVKRAHDGKDRRRVWVQLTPDGMALAQTLVADAKIHERALLSELADTDAARIKVMLQTVLKRLDER